MESWASCLCEGGLLNLLIYVSERLSENDSDAQSGGALWMLYCMLQWLSDFCQNVNVATVRLSFRLLRAWQRHQSLTIVFRCFLFPWGGAAIVTRGFYLRIFLRVREWVNGWDYPRGLIISYSFFPLKRWNLHRPVFENSPQPQAGGLWQNHPTAAGNAALAGSHHLCQWRRHTVRTAAHSGSIHVARACWWLAMFRSLISEWQLPRTC